MTIAQETSKLTLAIAAYGNLVNGQVTNINTTLGVVKGSKEQLLFFSQDGTAMAVKGDELLKRISLITTDQQLTDAKGQTVDFASVFNNWKRFSHDATQNQPAVEAELSAWAYNSGTNQISNTTNSATFIGLVSPEKFSDYVFEVDISSNNGDNDILGIVLAYAEVNGKQYTLSLLRSTGGMGYKLMTVAYNWAGGTGNGAKDIGSKNGGLKWGDGVVDDTRVIDNAGVYSTGWSTAGTGCRVKATRVGNTITVISSNMNDNANYVASSQIVINLASDPLLAKFMGAAQYGYCAYSQPNGTWKALQAPAVKYNIYDRRNDHIWKWNGSAWVDSGYVTDAALDKNRLYKNIVDGAAYYCDLNGKFIALGSPGLAL